jgi:hypothetical protein
MSIRNPLVFYTVFGLNLYYIWIEILAVHKGCKADSDTSVINLN